MKSQKACLIGCGSIFLMILLAAPQVKVWAENKKKQWVVFHDQIPEISARYNVTLQYVPSESTFYSASRSNIESTILRGGKKKDGYKEQLDFGTAADGYRYFALLRDASDFCLISRDGRRMRKAKILRSRQKKKPEIVKEGHFFLNGQIEIPFEVPGQQLTLPTNELVPGTFSINIYGHDPHSYRSTFSTRLKGSLTGSTSTESVNLEVSITCKKLLKPEDRQVKLTIKPHDDNISTDSAEGKITDILKLRSAKLVVEKIASDSSEIVLAVIHGDIKQIPEEKLILIVNKPVPAFARVDLIQRRLFTLDDFCKKAGAEGYTVLIFGDLKREPLDYHYRSQETNRLTLDETMVIDILQRDLDTPPVVVFVCRQFLFSDLYEKWLGQEPSFYIVADCSNPMDVRFLFPFSREPRHHRPSVKIETLREQFLLPENKLSVLLVNSEGNLIYINVDAGQQLAESLTRINKLMRNNKHIEK